MRSAPILAAASLLVGAAVILFGGGIIAGDEALSLDAPAQVSTAEPLPPPAVPEPEPETPDAAPTADVPAAPASSRLVAPKIVAPPQVDVRELQREAPREPLSQLSLALPPPPKPKQPGKWNGTSFLRPVATESAIFESMDHTVSIAGTEGLAADETCLADGVAWPCGARARAAFRLWLRGRAVVCKVPPGTDAVHIVAPCRLGKEDVGAWLVANGWARAAPGGPYAEDAERAQSARLGIYGDPPDTSGLGTVPPPPAPIFGDQTILVE